MGWKNLRVWEIAKKRGMKEGDFNLPACSILPSVAVTGGSTAMKPMDLYGPIYLLSSATVTGDLHSVAVTGDLHSVAVTGDLHSVAVTEGLRPSCLPHPISL